MQVSDIKEDNIIDCIHARKGRVICKIIKVGDEWLTGIVQGKTIYGLANEWKDGEQIGLRRSFITHVELFKDEEEVTVIHTPKEYETFTNIWLERDYTTDEVWPRWFKEAGIPNNHTFITKATSLEKDHIIALISEAEQICFNSAFLPPGFTGYESTSMVKQCLQLFKALQLKGKKVYSAHDLLESLNSTLLSEHPGSFRKVFEDNEVYELYEGGFCRIKWSTVSKQYEYAIQNSNDNPQSS